MYINMNANINANNNRINGNLHSMNMNVVEMEMIGPVKHIKISLLYGVLNFIHQLN